MTDVGLLVPSHIQDEEDKKAEAEAEAQTDTSEVDESKETSLK